MDIHCVERGAGKSVVLLHGFPMNQEVWNDFATELSASSKVYTPDLPGFGQSKSLSSPFSIDDVADRMLSWLITSNIQNCILVGHSLGGYIALAMVNKRPDLFNGLVLFHSTAYADSTEKKESRSKVIEFISKNGVVPFTSNFIQPLFTNPSHPAIAYVQGITIKAKEETVVGYTEAMRDRPDRTNVFTSFNKPILIIGGRNDAGIPVESLHVQGSLSKKSKVYVLEDTAHMGMFESPEETITLVAEFVARN